MIFSPDSRGNFLDHLEAFRRVLLRGGAVIALLLIPGFYVAPYCVGALVRHCFPPGIGLNYFSPMEPLLVQMKLALVLALAGALPVIVWEFGRFITPGLYRSERRYLIGGGVASLLLFVGGCALAYFGVLPLLMQFSLSLAGPELRPVIGIGSFLELAGLLMLGFGVCFQLPVVVVLLVRAGIVRSSVLSKARPIVVVVIFVVAAVLTPPDVVSQLMMGVPAWLLFELSLLFARAIEPHENEKIGTPAESDAADSTEPPPDSLQSFYEISGRKKRKLGFIGGKMVKKRGKK